jgi:hypothetical protein
MSQDIRVRDQIHLLRDSDGLPFCDILDGDVVREVIDDNSTSPRVA